ncbi:MAG TPA: alginate export family protein [Chitinophagaceae bacterium]|jgi:hypothetical protein|nr:alginate export family protein [Chitinophagaceae bacterium]
MLKKIKKQRLLWLVVFTTAIHQQAGAQFTLEGQLRTRTEIRHGVGNLVLKNAAAASFTSQRTRLLLGYKWERLSMGVSIQDVRVWGQDASSISATDGNRLMLHEAWASVMLLDKKDSTIKWKLIDQLLIKIGRQELSYDDVRLIGNLDWLQQARRHDMVLLKALHKGWQLELGQAFNQNGDAFGVTGSAYVPANIPPYIKNSLGVLMPVPAGLLPLAAGGSINGNSSKTGTPVFTNPPATNGGNQQYKSFTSVYITKKLGQVKLSGLFFNDNFSKYKLDSTGNSSNGYVYGRRFASAGSADEFNYSGTHHRYTYGLMVNTLLLTGKKLGSLSLQAAYYQQSGSNRDGITSSAFHYTIAASWQKGNWTFTPGYDVLSGDRITTGTDERFDPLYGTPHKHWGFMDYFYVATGSAAGGLRNPYLKTKYSHKRVGLSFDLHHFALQQPMYTADGNRISPALGNEVDLVFNYALTRSANIELGYANMFATGSMAIAKGQASTEAAAASYNRTGSWAYAMIRFSPDFLYKPAAKAK